jgi:hypothetical protein
VSIYSVVVILRTNQAVPCSIGQLNGVRSPLNGLKYLSPLQYGANILPDSKIETNSATMKLDEPLKGIWQ